MRKEDFAEILGSINENYVEEAASIKKVRKPVWLKWGAVAACLCLVAAGSIFYRAQNPADFQTMVAQGSVNTVAYMTQVPINDWTAVYQQMNFGGDKLERFVGAELLETGSAIWYRPDGSGNLKYLIREDESGALTLWAFISFKMNEGETYTYGDVLSIIFGVECAEDIVSITTSPIRSNSTDIGEAIQKEVGTHTYSDPEDISAFYDIAKNIVCFGCCGAYRDNPADNTRFTYSFSTEKSDKLTSGESTYGTRCLSIALADGTTLDSWKYDALSGSFFEYHGIFTEPLAEDDVHTLNEIFGIQ